MRELPIDLPAAVEVASAATQQPWRLSGPDRCGDVVIAEVGHLEVTAAQAPLWAADDPVHERDAVADARHIATFDPPTVLALLRRLELLERAVDLHAELAAWLAVVAVEAGADPVAILDGSPPEARTLLAVLVPELIQQQLVTP